MIKFFIKEKEIPISLFLAILCETVLVFLYDFKLEVRLFLLCLVLVFNFAYYKFILSNDRNSKTVFFINGILTLTETMICFEAIHFGHKASAIITSSQYAIWGTLFSFFAVVVFLRYLSASYLLSKKHKTKSFFRFKKYFDNNFLIFLFIFLFQMFYFTFSIKSINMFFCSVLLLFFLTNTIFFYKFRIKMIALANKTRLNRLCIRYSISLFIIEITLFSIYSSFIFGTITRDLPFHVYIGSISYYVFPLLIIMFLRILMIKIISNEIRAEKERSRAIH